MIPKQFQPFLIIVVGIAMLAYFGYERSDWIGLQLDKARNVGAQATLVDKKRVHGGLGMAGRTGVVMTVEYDAGDQTYREELTIQNFRGGADAVQVGQSIPILYDADNPSRAIFAAESSPGADEWAILALGLGFIGLGVAQWGNEDVV